VLETLYNHEDTEERCGLVLTDGSIVEIENVAQEKTDSYDMNPVAVLPFLEKKIVAGTWHTHPKGDPNLSGEDYSGFLAYPDLEHSIIGWRNGAVAVQTYRVEKGLVVVCG
jgi:proteasome lid subunit RPN8/RPN11